MNYKDLKGYLIAVDLDNTIITGFDTIDKDSFDILKELSKNNYIVIATGRPWRSSKYFYDLLSLNTPIINYNGAYVHHPKDDNFEEIFITIDKDKLIKFTIDNKDLLVNIFSEIKDDIYLDHLDDYIEPYLHLDGGICHTGPFKDILIGNPNGAILFSKLDKIDELYNYVNNNYKDVLIRYWFTNETVVSELYNPKVSKAKAIEHICKYYNIPKEKTIAIGDGHNDIEMINYAHIGVAMENSHIELINNADVVTKTVFDSGVSEFFKTYDF